jgi:hypothetical protein
MQQGGALQRLVPWLQCSADASEDAFSFSKKKL